MDTWEYKLVQLDYAMSNRGGAWQASEIDEYGQPGGIGAAPERLKDYGEQGWEVVGSAQANDGGKMRSVLIFKRRKA